MSRSISQKNRAHDRIMGIGIRTLGTMTVLAVVGILVIIVMEVVPLFYPAHIDKRGDITFHTTKKSAVVAGGVDAYFENIYSILKNGQVEVVPLAHPKHIQVLDLHHHANETILTALQEGNGRTSVLWSSGRVTYCKVAFRPEFAGDTRKIVPFIKDLGSMVFTAPLPESAQCRIDEDGVEQYVGLAKGVLKGVTVYTEEGLFGEGERVKYQWNLETASPVTQYVLDYSGSSIYAYTHNKMIYRWKCTAQKAPILKERFEKRGVSCMAMAIGDQELLIGKEDGTVETLAPVFIKGDEQGRKILKTIRTIKLSSEVPIRQLVPSPRDRTFLVEDGEGSIEVWYGTNQRYLCDFPQVNAPLLISFSERGRGITTLDTKGSLSAWELSCEHPEFNTSILFENIWYAGYSEPSYEWQSSSGSNDFESKMSLIPLIFGSFKAAFYSLMFAVPLAILGAVYTNQCMSSSMRAWVKPTVEMMAGIPSVVVGFLAALWLAPLVDRNILSIALYLIAAPLSIIACSALMGLLPLRLSRVVSAIWLQWLFGALLLGILSWPVIVVSGVIEGEFFEGNFRNWLIITLGGKYDMRNSIIISIALGFTVIPIIFTMAEDALSNVPRQLSSASLALGATPWQTVRRVVIPAAAPGLFSAIMLGTARSIGETMIVLMATGNTAVIDCSIFNGLRSLAANIAVEIPEAPQGGTLYRILFLSAALMLILSSIFNTSAEVIRSKLHNKIKG